MKSAGEFEHFSDFTPTSCNSLHRQLVRDKRVKGQTENCTKSLTV